VSLSGKDLQNRRLKDQVDDDLPVYEG
jgi:hypothetical protein